MRGEPTWRARHLRQFSRLGLAACIALCIPSARAADPDALWKIVSGRCVLGERAQHDPAPCTSVNETAGSAVLKDITGKTQYLLIPTAKISGIESPDILKPGSPNFFAQAWDARALVQQRSGHELSRRDYALAINSERGRSQNQLHIHIDCIRTDIRAILDRYQNTIGPQWALLPKRLRLHTYRARWIGGDALGDTNPFRLLADGMQNPAEDMGRHTLVLVGGLRDGAPGFILLDGRSGLLTASLTDKTDVTRLRIGPGSGEELEDHACRIAERRPASTRAD